MHSILKNIVIDLEVQSDDKYISHLPSLAPCTSQPTKLHRSFDIC